MMKTKLSILLFLFFGAICHAQEVVTEEDFPIYEIVGNDTIYQVVEEAPIYPGAGLSELWNYISNEIVYPTDATLEGIEGRVVVSFIIDKDGSMKNFIIERSVYPSLDKEAIRVLKSVPYKWTPARHEGRVVKMRNKIAINFAIPNEMKSDNVIVEQFISENLDENYEFHIIELEPAKKFNYTAFRNQYITPSIMEDKAAENLKILDDIKAFSQQNPIESYIPVIIGTRSKGGNTEWEPEWYFLFLDSDRNVLDIFYYYP